MTNPYRFPPPGGYPPPSPWRCGWRLALRYTSPLLGALLVQLYFTTCTEGDRLRGHLLACAILILGVCAGAALAYYLPPEESPP